MSRKTIERILSMDSYFRETALVNRHYEDDINEEEECDLTLL